MSKHILVLSIGPVQEFIQQARRTRDLWFGSHLLSELARAAAKAIVEGGGELIFPPFDRGSKQLEPSDGPGSAAVANKVIAVVPEGIDAGKLGKEARQAARIRLVALADEVKRRCDGLLAPGIDASWREQIDSLLEYFAAAVAIDEAKGGFAAARRRAEALLSARKALREFDPWEKQRGNVPKSSLDGARETVLREPKQRDPQLVRRYRIADGEQLDAVGLLKRAGGDPDQFAPIVNVALADWIERAAKTAPSAMDQAKTVADRFGFSAVRPRHLTWPKTFPYDAQIFLSERWASLLAETGRREQDAATWRTSWYDALVRAVGRPYPYVACLVADGDRIGKALDGAGSERAAREFSQALASFAGDAKEIVENQCRGVLVYAGGDDVLAFIGLADALRCAEALSQAFAKRIATIASLPREASSESPTLSVGIGIGHIHEAMGDLLDLGREAERVAKGDGLVHSRNALAIVFDKRSGGKLTWRARWDGADAHGGLSPIEQIRKYHRAIAASLSTKKIYEVKATLRRFPSDDKAGDEWLEPLRRDVLRSLSRSDRGDGSAITMPGDLGLAEMDSVASYQALRDLLERFVSLALIARVVAAGSRWETHDQDTAEVAP